MTTYKMTTISNGTRIRTEPNTAGSILASVNANVTVQGDELFTATAPLSNSAGTYQYVGDKWLKVSYNGVTGWMAYIHKAYAICNNFEVVSTTPPTDPPPVVQFPQSFILTDPATGKKAEFVFVREIE